MKKYDHRKIERKWQQIWLREKVYEPNLEKAKAPFYNLMMFPYPSAEGLHVGNMYAFTGSDIYGRLKRMQGHDVFEPIGLDGFGIHSENYALKIGQHPMEQAKFSQKNFYRQLGLIGNGFAWNEKLETYDPEYYKWTQWIFIQLFRKGLAYRKKALVNWCPSCLTVLADEQVISGECERCGTKVIKKELEQWFFRITKYADKLLKGLGEIDPVRNRAHDSVASPKDRGAATSNGIDWSEKVKIAQKNWIGKSEGAEIRFPLVNVPGQPDGKFYVEVFTTRPDTIFGVTFVTVSPELAKFWLDIGWQAPETVKKYIAKALAERGSRDQNPDKEKTGVFSGISAINPANKERVPVWVSDYVLAGYGTGAIMGVPAHDERDFEFAAKLKLPVSNAPLVSIEEGIKKSGGRRKIQYRLRDWLISRQRYWGPPIPMIHCGPPAGGCGWQPVPEKDLPVKLPYIKEFRPTGTSESPLATDEKFYKVKCPKCGGPARRETDVSDTFLDSAWYYIGYLLTNPPPTLKPRRASKSQTISNFQFPRAILEKWLPVDMYIGGAEHSVLHLLYVRFLAMVFKDLRLTNFDEPFKKFRAHGLLIKDGVKMSKSKGNVVNPDEYIAKYGADVLRMYLMFLGPFDQGGDFRDGGIKGITRFLERVWQISTKPQITNHKQITNSNIQTKIHKTIKKVTEDIENLSYNTAISALMILLNELESAGSVSHGDLEVFVKLLTPFAPHISEEIYREVLKNKRSIHLSEWPKHNADLIKEDEFDLVVQVNGKVRAVIRMSVDSAQKEAETAARSNKNVSKYLNSPVKKVIFVKDKFINFVV